ncbi:MAG: type II toxin-antitoxin system RelE/ParE family toxin [Blastocatellales bacterium]
MYEIRYVESIADDVKRLSAGQRKQILNRIEAQLAHEPARQTRNRKILVGLVPPWEHVEPVWELRIGEYRAFYDVDDAAVTPH